ncbi:MAG: hypothetical protein ACRYF1_06405 [Janthinobacterium lividum]
MIETFVQQRIVDPADWYTRVPPCVWSGTVASEKVRSLEAICDIIARTGSDAVAGRRDAPAPIKASEQNREVAAPAVGSYQFADPAAVVRPTGNGSTTATIGRR